MYKRICIISAVLLILGVALGFFGFPMAIKKLIQSQVNLKPESTTRQMWEKSPIPINFGVYVFNITNPEETQMGGKPNVHEIGPFMFEEWKDKYDLVDFDNEDAVAFNMRNTFKFRPDLGLSGEEVITMPHPLIQFMAISIKRFKPEAIAVIAAGLQLMFDPSTPFVTAPFMDIFFRGIEVDCSNDNEAVQAICANFHSNSVKGAVKIDDTHYKLSLMGGNNHTSAGRFKVSRGMKNSADIGKVLAYNDMEQLVNWNGDECNQFHGTDSTIFSSFLNPKDGLWSFSPDLCRSLGVQFKSKTKYAGISAIHYTWDFGDIKNEPENQCFCNNFPTDCPLKGTQDLSRCTSQPMIASMPHFLNGATELLEAVDGLNPQKEKHMIFMDVEIISGTPLSVAKRLQFNLDVEPVAELEVMKDLRKLVMPLFWVEESVSLGPAFTNGIKKKVFGIFKINNAFKWVTIVLGGFGLVLSIYMMIVKRRDSQIMTLVAPAPATADATS